MVFPQMVVHDAAARVAMQSHDYTMPHLGESQETMATRPQTSDIVLLAQDTDGRKVGRGNAKLGRAPGRLHMRMMPVPNPAHQSKVGIDLF
jgi:hypothetical protein